MSKPGTQTDLFLSEPTSLIILTSTCSKKVLTVIQKIPTFTKEIKLIFIYDKLIYNKLHIVGYDFGYTVLTNLVCRLTLEKKI